MKDYYVITSAIRYYRPQRDVDLSPEPHSDLRVTHVLTSGKVAFDVSRWKDAPHVALANLRDEPEAVLRFTRTYGMVTRDGRKTVPVREVLDCRDWLRRAWEGDTDNVFALPAGDEICLVAQARGGFHIAVFALWPLVQVMFIQDWPEKRIRKCANPDCPAPYFRADRKGQKFCGQKCAVLINVRRFREREAQKQSKKRKVIKEVTHAKAKKA